VQEPERFTTRSAHPRLLNTTTGFLRRQLACRLGLCPVVRALVAVLTMIGMTQNPVWSAGTTDIIWLESNSTAGNSILTFKNDGSGRPIFLGSTPAGGIGVFDKTFALGPFDSDQNVIVNDD